MNGSLGFRCDETIQFKEKLEQKTGLDLTDVKSKIVRG